MGMIEVIRKEEELITELEKNLAAEDQAIEARKAAGEPMRSCRYMDLAREIRRRKRDVKRAKAYMAEAARRRNGCD